jgi:PEP-CTERM motif
MAMKCHAIALAVLFAAGGFLGSANASSITVDAFASAQGTPITIGNSATPQYSFFDGTFIIFPANYIQGNNGNLVSFPFNGTTQPLLPAVATDIFGNATDGNYQLAFDIGTTPYTGLATVIGAGATQEITTITYSSAVSPVPLPSTWGMMLMGLVGLGFMAYRQKSKPALMAS